MAMLVDEHGAVEGMVTLKDVMVEYWAGHRRLLVRESQRPDHEIIVR